ncbi:MAG TPA: sulfatase-like hydrolase/transferase, partial [Thermoplasmata archaeon]|nr:sulfatase-like hydrolase/transferase [Thermoplasmata archaeon]
LPLDPTVPRLPSLLRTAGYASLSLSANPLLNSQLGLVGGFDAAAWSEWWEPYVRNTPGALRSKSLTTPAEGPGVETSRLQKLHDSPLVSLLHRSADLVYRYPFAVSAANHLLQRVALPRESEHALVARWIDPTLERWIAGLPREQPAFVFANLLEAHEPYFVDRSVIRTLREYWEYATTWQDRPSVLSGRWTPAAEELRLLHALYRSTFRLLEKRVEGIVKILTAAGRWENTLFILTSDHGQAFLEHGTLFHMHRPDEGLLRVPFWVRYPGGADGGSVARGWASLVDVAPTALGSAGVPVPLTYHGVDLRSLVREDRGAPVFAMADGLALAQEARQLAPARMAWIDRSWVAAYEGDRKVTYDLADRRFHAYRIDQDPSESRDEWPENPAPYAALSDEAKRVADLLSSAASGNISEEVEDRLRSWGYV